MLHSQYIKVNKTGFALPVAGADSGYHERRLLEDLMDSYNKLERPVYNESEAVDLTFGLTLQQIIDVVGAEAAAALFDFGIIKALGDFKQRLRFDCNSYFTPTVNLKIHRSNE
jgi:hypothetical protein